MEYTGLVVTFAMVFFLLTVVTGLVRFVTGEEIHKETNHKVWLFCAGVEGLTLVVLLCMKQNNREMLGGLVGDAAIGVMFSVIVIAIIFSQYTFHSSKRSRS